MKINEIFLSIQGEGKEVGMLSWFIRCSGCNLRCKWCDSAYAFEEGKEMNIESIKDSIPTDKCKNVIITGGEPFIQKDLLKLIKKLSNRNIYIETNGTIFDPFIIGFANITVSPKLQFLNKEYIESLRKWSGFATFKFVIEDRKSFNDSIKLCNKLMLFEKTNNIYFMPEGISSKKINANMKSITEWLKETGVNARISPRLQIYLWENKRGT